MEATKRKGDKVKIKGSYQHDAITTGNIIQRTWHILKLKTAVELAALCPGANILDIGCGSGTLTTFLPGEQINYLGLDANQEAINFAKKQYEKPNTHFELFQLDDLEQLPANKFSAIFFLETIEHITEQQGLDTIAQMHRLTRPGGICIISTPNRNSLWPAIEWMLDFFRLTPRLKGEQHERLYTTKELKTLVIKAGFSIKNAITINGIAPWTSFLGKRVTTFIHRKETSARWIPGSLIMMALEKQ